MIGVGIAVACAQGSLVEAIEHIIAVGLGVLGPLAGEGARRGAGATGGRGACAARPGEAIQPIIAERLVIRALRQGRGGAGDIAHRNCSLGNKWFTC